MIDTKAEYALILEASPWNESAERTYAFAMGWRAKAEHVRANPPKPVISDQRGLFEQAFPVKFNVEWNPADQCYKWNRANNSLTEAMEQNIRWKVWQAAVAANLGE